MSSSVLDLIDTTTVFSLLSTLAILAAAYTASLYALSSTTSTKIRLLFIWHAFDALIHFILEGSYLYNCFYTFIDLTSSTTSIDKPSSSSSSSSSSSHASEFLPPNVYFLGYENRLYGSNYGLETNLLAALWREYAKADRRWGGSDLTVISLELLTVFLGGPVAVWVCVCLARDSSSPSVKEGEKSKVGGHRGSGSGKKGLGLGRAWFWMVVLATGELYGGFMTFCPEWLSGSPNLDTSNIMYKWVYLFFFNTLWVWIPLYILYEGYGIITSAITETQGTFDSGKKTT